jgi:Uma2 family endonuclease
MASATLILDDTSLSLPGDAFRLDGFLRWRRSSSYRNGFHASFLGGDVHLEMSSEASLCIPSDAFRLDGFLQWVHSAEFPAQARPSFLNGEVSIDMSAEEIVTHNRAKSDLGADMTSWSRRHDLGLVFADGALLVNEKAGLSTVPDLIFCLWASFKTGRVRLAERVDASGRFVEMRGSPDLVVEIISDSSVRKDTRLLPPLYFAAGVQEYWLIDARRSRLDFKIFVRGRKKLVPVRRDAGGYLQSRVLQGAFRLSRRNTPVSISEYRLVAKKPLRGALGED